MAEMIYYKRNVGYVVGGRFSPTDSQGWTMTSDYPYIMVPVENLRDFKLVNRRAITEGLIVESEAPSVDWETPNTITDAEAEALVKQFIPLKQKLVQITSLPAAVKLLEAAKEAERPPKTIKLIEAKVAELSDDDGEFGSDKDGE